MMTDADRFFNHVKYSEGCWEWRGALANKKQKKFWYGVFWRGDYKKQVRAHRWSYEYFRGPIPKGVFVLHHCDNPKCVNPFHLFLGSAKDNAEDMVNKKRHRNQRKTHCVNGHKYSEETLHMRGERRACNICITRQRRERLDRGDYRNTMKLYHSFVGYGKRRDYL